MNRALFFLIGTISAGGFLSAAVWADLHSEATDRGLANAALKRVREKAPQAQIELVSATVERRGDEGVVKIKVRIDRAVDWPGRQPEIQAVNEYFILKCGSLVLTPPPATKIRQIHPTGSQELTFSYAFHCQMSPVPQFPFLGAIKAKSELSLAHGAASVHQDLFVDSLHALVLKGKLDDACHDFDRVALATYVPGNDPSSVRLYTALSQNQPPPQRQVMLTESEVCINAYRRRWTASLYALDQLRAEGKNTWEGRKAIHRGEAAVGKLYDSLTEREKKLLAKSEWERPPVRPTLTKF